MKTANYSLAGVLFILGMSVEAATERLVWERSVSPGSIQTQQSEGPAAERVRQVLDEFLIVDAERRQGNKVSEKVARLDETEVNAYLKSRLAEEDYPGVQRVTVKLLGDNRVAVTTTVDFNSLNLDDSGLAVRSMRAMLSGTKVIYTEGRITSKDGTGQFHLEKASVGTVRLPVILVETLASLLGSDRDPPLALSEPSPLPYGLKEVEITEGFVTLRSWSGR